MVLGAAVWPGGKPSPTLLRRTKWACKMFNKGGYDLIVLSGGLGKNAPTEADIMASIALASGVPERSLLLDRQAARTIDTAAFAASMPPAFERNFVAVTDLYRSPRTSLAFLAYGLKVKTCTPPLGHGTRSSKIIRSFLREIPAIGLYFAIFLRLRLRSLVS